MLWVAILFAQPVLQARFTPKAPRLGDLVRVEVRAAEPIGGQDAPRVGSVRAFFCEHPLVRTDAGWSGYVAVPADTSTGTHDLQVSLGSRTLEAELTVRSRDFESSILRVAPKYTRERSPELQARIDREQAMFDAVWSSPPTVSRPQAPLLEPPEPPTRGRRTGRFGTRRVFNGTVASVHYGLDLSAPTGRPVMAAWSGRVALVGHMWGSGNTVVLDHGAGLHSAYYHLSRIDVERNDSVDAGQWLGRVGATGRVTGPHLHWALALQCRQTKGPNAGSWRSMYVDPEPLLDSSL